MIKRLLLLATIFAPVLAYAANPSNDFSVQIVPPGSGGGSGGGGGGSGGGSGGGGGSNGGGGSPAAPVQALAGCQTSNGGSATNGSCLNTLVLNLDFTGATTSSAPPINNSFDATNLANVIDCKGASPAILVNNNSDVPCSDDSIVTGSEGLTALQQQYTLNDYNNGVAANASPAYNNNLVSTIQGGSNSYGNAFVAGQPGTYPTAYYFEARLQVQTTGQPPNGCGNCLAGGPWVWGGNGVDYQEEDFDEWYLPWERMVLQNGSNQTNYGGLHLEGLFNGNPNQWYTIGMRKTVSGNTAEICGYFNNVQVQCGTETDPSSQPFSARTGLVLWSGDAGNNNNGQPVPYGNMSFQYEWIHLWSCSTWWQNGGSYTDGTGCNGALITSNP